MWYCPKCGFKNDDKHLSCVSCGLEVPDGCGPKAVIPIFNIEKRKWPLIPAVLVLVIGIALGLIFATREMSPEDAQEKVAKLMTSERYTEADVEQRIEMAGTLLEKLYRRGAISEEPVYDEASGMYTFEFSDGILGAVMVEPFDPELNGAGYASPGLSDMQQDGLRLPVGDECGASVLVLNGFEDKPSRRDFYKKLKKEWGDDGFSLIDIDTAVSVEDFLYLDRYDVVIFAMHGNTYNNIPVLFPNNAPATAQSDDAYRSKLENHELVKAWGECGWRYLIMPQFFVSGYPEGALDGVLICSESCKFFGNDSISKKPDSTMADAFTTRSNCAVVGYHNSVEMNYSRNIIKYLVEGVAEGKPLESVFEAAKVKYGKDDGWENFGKDKYKAYPIVQSTCVPPEVEPEKKADYETYGYLWGDFIYSQYNSPTLALMADVTHDGIPELIVIEDKIDYWGTEGHVWTFDQNMQPVLIHEKNSGYTNARGSFNWKLACVDEEAQYYEFQWLNADHMTESSWDYYSLSQDGEPLYNDAVFESCCVIADTCRDDCWLYYDILEELLLYEDPYASVRPDEIPGYQGEKPAPEPGETEPDPGDYYDPEGQLEYLEVNYEVLEYLFSYYGDFANAHPGLEPEFVNAGRYCVYDPSREVYVWFENFEWEASAGDYCTGVEGNLEWIFNFFCEDMELGDFLDRLAPQSGYTPSYKMMDSLGTAYYIADTYYVEVYFRSYKPDGGTFDAVLEINLDSVGQHGDSTTISPSFYARLTRK